MKNEAAALIVEPDGSSRVQIIDATAAGVGAIVGGWLEGLATDNASWVAYGDEEGALKSYPVNPRAGAIIHAMSPMSSVLPVGTVVFLGLRYAGPESGHIECDIPAGLLQYDQ